MEVLMILVLVIVLLIIYQIYVYYYFKSIAFKVIKSKINKYILNFNKLNEYIEDLKFTSINLNSVDYGDATRIDTSNYNFKRSEWYKNNNQSYNCSLSVCKNASDQPFKYLIKYFNIDISEDFLEKFEALLNTFLSVEQGIDLLNKEKDKVLKSIKSNTPPLVYKFSKRAFARKLGFIPINFSNNYIPTYTFQYVSSGGNSSLHVDIHLNINTLNKLILYLNNLIKWRESIRGQRALMTSKLREKIKSRDNYTCQKCGVSIMEEPHLLLEIDHIIPISKGGITSEANLQTLCWKCNRSKGSKLS